MDKQQKAEAKRICNEILKLNEKLKDLNRKSENKDSNQINDKIHKN